MSDIDSIRSSKTDIDNPEVLFVKQLSPKVLLLFNLEMENIHVKCPWVYGDKKYEEKEFT